MSKFNFGEKSPKYGSPEFIDFVRENYHNLINGKQRNPPSFSLASLYNYSGGRFRKFPFFIYWLWAEMSGLWTFENLKKIKDGKISSLSCIRKIGDDEICKILLKIYEDDPESIFKFPEFDLSKIRSRYIKRGAVEKAMNEILRENLKLIFSSINEMSKLLTLVVEEFLFLEKEILGFIQSERVVIQSDMRRKKRQFQKINIELFESIINDLEKKQKISIKIYNRRKFLIYKK